MRIRLVALPSLAVALAALGCRPPSLADSARTTCDQAGYYTDADGDGYGDAVSTCGDPAAVYINGDCDDANPDVNPDAVEVCNGIDDNCDGHVDEGLAATVYYPDADGDGYGAPGSGESLCAAPASGYALTNDDCDDANPAVNPGAVELCDGIDNTCGGTIDGHVATWFGADGTTTDETAATGDLALTGDGELAICDGTWFFRPIIAAGANVTLLGTPGTSGSVTLDAQGNGTNLTVGAHAIVRVDTMDLVGGRSTGNGGDIGIDSDANVTVTSVNLTGGTAAQGGGIYVGSGGTLTLTGGSVASNSATSGGGIYADATATVDVTDTSFSANGAVNGGAIAARAATITLTSVTVDDNTATAGGAGVTVAGGTLGVTTSVFERDQAGTIGGAIAATSNATLSFDGADFSQDNAGTNGGAVFLDGASLTATAGGFTGCAANDLGGAISAQNSSLSLDNVTFSSNNAGDGGAIYGLGEAMTISNSTFDSNSATDLSGALYADASSSLQASNDTFTGNTSLSGAGAIGLNTVSDTTITGGSFTGNSSSTGGAAYVAASTVTFDSVMFSSNAAVNGGALCADSSTLTLTGDTFDGNAASGVGGGVYALGQRRATNTVTLSGVELRNNTAQVGAGVYGNGPSTVAIAARTTFDGNTASSHGGGLALGQLGDLYTGSSTCADSTLTSGSPEDAYLGLSPVGGAFSSTACTFGAVELAGSGTQAVGTDFSCTSSGCI